MDESLKVTSVVPFEIYTLSLSEILVSDILYPWMKLIFNAILLRIKIVHVLLLFGDTITNAMKYYTACRIIIRIMDNRIEI